MDSIIHLLNNWDQETEAKAIYSQLSLNRHLYKMDTSLKWTPRVGPYLSLLPLFDSL